MNLRGVVFLFEVVNPNDEMLCGTVYPQRKYLIGTDGRFCEEDGIKVLESYRSYPELFCNMYLSGDEYRLYSRYEKPEVASVIECSPLFARIGIYTQFGYKKLSVRFADDDVIIGDTVIHKSDFVQCLNGNMHGMFQVTVLFGGIMGFMREIPTMFGVDVSMFLNGCAYVKRFVFTCERRYCVAKVGGKTISCRYD